MTDVISLKDAKKHFGKVKALDDFSMTVREGEIMGFIGPNGAGKSTTIRILLGLLKSHGGEISLFDKNPWKNAVELHKKLAYVPAEVAIWPTLTGGETIDFLARLNKANPKEQGFRRRRLHYTKLFDLDIKKKNKSYSTGNRKKVALISAFSMDVPLYILDEPTSGLDPLMEEVFKNCIKEFKQEGKTVLLSSHILSEVEKLCDRVTIIKHGKNIMTDTIENIKEANAGSDLEDIFLEKYEKHN
jgi:ABC-2 type transport system ATP-binding protein